MAAVRASPESSNLASSGSNEILQDEAPAWGFFGALENRLNEVSAPRSAVLSLERTNDAREGVTSTTEGRRPMSIPFLFITEYD